MKWQEQFYFRKGDRIPKFETLLEENENLALISLPWGNRDSVRQCLQKVTDFYIAAKEDNEATSPFSKKPQLSANLNNLMVGTQILNESMYKESNTDEYSSALELLGCYRDGNEFAWVACGGISLFQLKTDGQLSALRTGVNWSTGHEKMPNLPQQVLGVHKQINLDSGFTTSADSDRFFFVYKSKVKPLGWKKTSSDITIKDFVEANFSSNKSESFWVAELTF